MIPLRDYCIVKELKIRKKEEVTNGGIILPDNYIPIDIIVEILAVGPGFYQNGVLIVPDVLIGDICLVKKGAIQELKYNEDTIKIVKAETIVLILYRGDN